MGYKNQKYGKKAQRRNYSKMKFDIELPNLIEIQKNSFKQFIDTGIDQLLQDASPVTSANGELRLYFEKSALGEPKYTKQEAKVRDVNFASTLTCRVRLENINSGEIKEGQVVLTDLPIMTEEGTYIVNGAERVVVSQIVRSSGVYYTAELDKKVNQIKFAGQIIPTRGAWIEFEEGAKDILYAKLDRSKKIPLTTFIRTLGFVSQKDILDVFGKSKKLVNTLEKDDAKNPSEALMQLYSKLRSGEKAPADQARNFIKLRLFERTRYDLQAVGRFKFNQKLDVLSRAKGLYLTNDIVDHNGQIVIEKDTLINKEVADLISVNRHLIAQEVVSKELCLENETSDEIQAIKVDGQLTAKEDIINNMTGEVIVPRGQVITPEVIRIININRLSVDKKHVDFYLGKDINQKELERTGVTVEILDVYSLDSDGQKSSNIRIVGSNQDEMKEHVTSSDIIASISYYLNLYDGIGNTDDIDHLGNRRLRLIGELLTNQFRVGLVKVSKTILDKMSTTNFIDAEPKTIINTTPLVSAIKQFFGSSQLSQFMDQINPLAELTQKRRVSALGNGGISRDRAGVEVRDVHNSHYGRLCPIETPEGPSIGLISSLATYARVDEYGFIKTPFLRVKNNIVTQEIVYLTAHEETSEIIASAASELNEDATFASERVIARGNGETNFFDASTVTYMDVSPKQLVSVGTSSIPFLEHDDASRALMGANMQRQAVPLLRPAAPIVGTGIEYRAAKDSGAVVIAKESGYVVHVESTSIITVSEPTDTVYVGNKAIYTAGGEFNYMIAKTLYDYGVVAATTYELVGYFRSNQDSLVLQRPIVVQGEFVEAGDTIADGPSTKNGELALGRNVTVAFMTWDGYNYEDAIIMSEDLVKNDIYTSIHLEKYEIETRDIKGAEAKDKTKEKITREIPNVGQEQLRKLDERGIIVEGSEVKAGDILVGKITPRGTSENTAAEKLIYAIIAEKSREYRDSSLRVPHGGGGIVQSVKHYYKIKKGEAQPYGTEPGDFLPSGVNEQIRVYIAQKRKITEGDKMAGRHGNKGVISKILPREDMPYMADGTPIDIMLNPLGVPSRMNIGQILEIHLGISAQKLGIQVATPVFDGVTDQELRDIMAEAGIDADGKTVLYDGRTGEAFDNRISVGVMYMIKLSHMVDDKLHARNVGPYTLVTQQPMGGKAQNGGQRFGEMEVWALYAYGAAHTLQELLTIKSDDMLGRNKAYYSITHGKTFPRGSVPESFRVLTRELQALGLYVELLDAKDGSNEAIKSLVDNNKKGRF